MDLSEDRDSRAANLSVPAAVAEPGECIGAGTWNINHLALRSEKLGAKIDAINFLFKANSWLEVLGLQEVNDIEALAGLSGDIVILSPGPRLVVQSLESDKELEARGARPSDERRTKERYVEWYPLVARKSAGFKVTAVTLFFSNETVPLDPGNCGDRVYRCSEENPAGFRPVVVYTLQRPSRAPVHFGIVHTTPAGTEFVRLEIFRDQIAGVLARLPRDGLWILCGDYYLAEEARVVSMKEAAARSSPVSAHDLNAWRNTAKLTFGKNIPAHLEILTSLSGTNPKKGFSATPDGRDRIQIADFFLCSKNWPTKCAGMFGDPDFVKSSATARLVVVDVNAMVLEEWARISDHAPVGALLSTSLADGKLAASIRGYDKRVLEVSGLDIQMFQNITKVGFVDPSGQRKMPSNPELSQSLSPMDFAPDVLGSMSSESARVPCSFHSECKGNTKQCGRCGRFVCGAGHHCCAPRDKHRCTEGDGTSECTSCHGYFCSDVRDHRCRERV